MPNNKNSVHNLNYISNTVALSHVIPYWILWHVFQLLNSMKTPQWCFFWKLCMWVSWIPVPQCHFFNTDRHSTEVADQPRSPHRAGDTQHGHSYHRTTYTITTCLELNRAFCLSIMSTWPVWKPFKGQLWHLKAWQTRRIYSSSAFNQHFQHLHMSLNKYFKTHLSICRESFTRENWHHDITPRATSAKQFSISHNNKTVNIAFSTVF